MWLLEKFKLHNMVDIFLQDSNDTEREQQKLLHTTGGSTNWYSHFGENFGNIQVYCKMRIAYTSGNYTPQYVLWRNCHTYTKRNISNILTPLFTIIKIIQMSIQRDQAKCVIIIQWNTTQYKCNTILKKEQNKEELHKNVK